MAMAVGVLRLASPVLPQQQSIAVVPMAHTGRKTRKGAKIMKSIYSPAGFNIRRIRLRKKWSENPPPTDAPASSKSPRPSPKSARASPDKSAETAVATPEASPEAAEATTATASSEA
ncbi:hypothetical protein SELMODRAFT_442609 [Selaginella moellendorffii]|uniref:Uncharacterized protein n=1 Tax=Selaginella moellendorffii TaxID=88036 RepID=D8RUC4_SELML|nr:uncharacterized protein LOC9636895 isoform X1 [Selaginella moellendorffii]EFJ24183.1 hypothetical protein SELMODRAFT_442609 [Selaginella moellendorffii]|eukprot:XP_002974663.1 uncharacterized protein LOC9636895 isoform X1 [Selaginella moellendorffii]